MKYTLAIESSSATPSAALLQNNTILGEATWDTSRGSSQRMFSEITDMLQSSSITLDDIDLFAIGLGPGNFTGLRTTLAAIQAMALPSHTHLIGISSAEAAAYEFAETQPSSSRRILVVGDARRKRLWLGVFEYTDNNQLSQSGKFSLVSFEEFPAKIKKGDTIVSPDAITLEPELSALIPDHAILIKDNCLPTATAVARLARLRKENGTAGEPLQPIYMHPPVFVEPRFTESTKRRL